MRFFPGQHLEDSFHNDEFQRYPALVTGDRCGNLLFLGLAFVRRGGGVSDIHRSTEAWIVLLHQTAGSVEHFKNNGFSDAYPSMVREERGSTFRGYSSAIHCF